MPRFLIFILLAAILGACSKAKTEFSEPEIKYIRSLGLLDDGEMPVLFDTQMDFETSGNFISDRRIASYWIDKNDTAINSARYEDIDSITTKDLAHSLTWASYLRVWSNGGPPFDVYVDGDSLEVWTFFKAATTRWLKVKKQSQAK